MKFFDSTTAAARREGRRKAERDIDLVRQFIDVHEGRPEYAIMRKFFASLGDDVRPGPEQDVYEKRIGKFQTEVRESGMLRPRNAEPVVIPLDMSNLPESLATAVQQVFASAGMQREEEITVERAVQMLWERNPNMTPEDVDEMAAEHGHLTRDDECDGLQMLRAKIAERDGK